MRFARGLLSGVFFALFGLGGLLVGAVLFPPLALCGRRRAMRRLVRASWLLFVWGARVTGLFRVEVSPEDRRRLAAARGCVVVANHPALADVVVLATLLPDATAIAKAAAGSNFFYSRIVRGAFLVGGDAAGLLGEAKALLAGGTSLVVFPEGTRSRAGAPARRLRRGAAHIALQAGVPVLPVSLSVDPPVLAKGQPWYDVGDRTIVWRVRVCEEIPARTVPAGGMPAAAAALTRVIYGRLWP